MSSQQQEIRPPLPPFTLETAKEKVRLAEDGWNSRDAAKVALAYSLDRLQFGKPLAGYQLTQEKLVNMLLEIQKGTLLALHLGRTAQTGPRRAEIGFRVGAGARGVRRQVVEVVDAVAMPLEGHVQRLHHGVFAAEADAGEMCLATGLGALAPADDDGGDIQLVAQGELQRRHQQSGTAMADHGPVGIDVERRKRIVHAAQPAIGMGSVLGRKLFAGHQGTAAEGFENAVARLQGGIGGGEQDHPGLLEAGIIEQQLRGDVRQRNEARCAGAHRRHEGLAARA